MPWSWTSSCSVDMQSCTKHVYGPSRVLHAQWTLPSCQPPLDTPAENSSKPTLSPTFFSQVTILPSVMVELRLHNWHPNQHRPGTAAHSRGPVHHESTSFVGSHTSAQA